MSQRKFTVYTYDNEIAGLKSLVSLNEDIETGGDLFGLWLDDDELVIQIIGGPGQHCTRTVTSFHQDVHYLENIGTYLTTAEGLCNVGEWHSHHRLGLARPSFGDEQTVWRYMPQLGLTKFVLFIANITGSKKVKSEINIGCFLFDKASNQVVSGEFKYLAEKLSPLRGKRKVFDVLKTGAELASSAGIEQQPTDSSGWKRQRNKRKKGKAVVQADGGDNEKTSCAKYEGQNQQIPAKQARRTKKERGEPDVKQTGRKVDSKRNEKRVQKDEKDGNFNGAKQSEKEELQANNEIDKTNGDGVEDSKLVGGNRNAEGLKGKLKTNSEKKEDRSDEHGKNSVLKEGKKTIKPKEIGTAKKVGKQEPGENRKKGDGVEDSKLVGGNRNAEGLKGKLKTNSEKKEDRSDEHGKNSVLKEGKKTIKPKEIGTAKKVGKQEPGENRKKGDGVEDSKLVGGNRNAEGLKGKLKTNSEKKEDRSDEHGKNSVLKEGKKTIKPKEIGTAKKVGKQEPGENRKKDEIEEEKMKNGREEQDGNSKVNKDGDKEDEEKSEQGSK